MGDNEFARKKLCPQRKWKYFMIKCFVVMNCTLDNLKSDPIISRFSKLQSITYGHSSRGLSMTKIHQVKLSPAIGGMNQQITGT